jgi:HB1/ASXL restriction endonuclease-like protein with HTH domain
MGSVAEAVVQILETAGTELSYIEIYQAVCDQLGGDVAKSSVKNSLMRACLGDRPLLVRIGRGRYRLFTREENESSCR